jgi:hypothetical protein
LPRLTNRLNAPASNVDVAVENIQLLLSSLQQIMATATFRLRQLKYTSGYGDLAKQVADLLKPTAIGFEAFLTRIPSVSVFVKLRLTLIALFHHRNIAYKDGKQPQELHLCMKRFAISIASDCFPKINSNEFFIQLTYVKDNRAMYFWIVFGK